MKYGVQMMVLGFNNNPKNQYALIEFAGIPKRSCMVLIGIHYGLNEILSCMVAIDLILGSSYLFNTGQVSRVLELERNNLEFIMIKSVEQLRAKTLPRQWSGTRVSSNTCGEFHFFLFIQTVLY